MPRKQTPKPVLTPEAEYGKIERAFAQLRLTGGFAFSRSCCPDCAIQKVMAQNGDEDSTVAVSLDEQVREAFPNGPYARMRRPLDIYHRGDSRMVCDALEQAGLQVQWSGSASDSIMVLPTTIH